MTQPNPNHRGYTVSLQANTSEYERMLESSAARSRDEQRALELADSYLHFLQILERLKNKRIEIMKRKRAKYDRR